MLFIWIYASIIRFFSHSIHFRGSKKKWRKRIWSIKMRTKWNRLSFVVLCCVFVAIAAAVLLLLLYSSTIFHTIMITDYYRNLYPFFLYFDIKIIWKKNETISPIYNSHKFEQPKYIKEKQRNTRKRYESKKKSKCVTYSGGTSFLFITTKDDNKCKRCRRKKERKKKIRQIQID